MKRNLIDRRELIKGLFSAMAPLGLQAASQKACILQDKALRFEVLISEGKIVSRKLHNRLADEILELPKEDFALEFEKGLTITSSALAAEVRRQTSTQAEFLFSASAGRLAGLEVRVQYEIPSGKAYLRKQILLRQTEGGSHRILLADLDSWRGVRRAWNSMRADRLKWGSHPIFCESLWAGVEFVAAFNEFNQEGFVLRSRPGGKLIGPEWVRLHSTVVGVAERGGTRAAFLRYIEDVRLAPPRLVACYNSWWTLPTVVKQDDNLALMRELKQKLYDQNGVFFDLAVTDMGWSDPRSIWKIDRASLPNGFDDIRAIVEQAGGKLGLWMSPSEVYPPVCDYEWAEKNGYEVLKSPKDKKGFGISLADPKYRREVKDQLQRLIQENGFGHIKYDGFIAEEDHPHNRLLPKEDSVEPLAAYSLELIRASKEANPELVSEPTYLNSLANYISPWIIKYADTVWGNSGGDCPPGLGPAPAYREAHTNAREYYIFSSLDELWLPQNAVQYFDIVHCDAGAGFPNHAAMAFGRGRFFVSTYLNPKFMSEDDWRIYAGLLRWARQNREILRNTRVLPSRVELGEPYAYAHWLGPRGILAVRNPSNETKEYVVDFRNAGAPKELAQAVCYTQYPYRKGVAAGLNGTSSLTLKLAPWELVFLEVRPRADLREPVAMGARWFRDGDGTMSIAPEGDVGRVQLLLPGSEDKTYSVSPHSQGDLHGQVTARTVGDVPEPEWFADKEKRFPTVGFDVECSVHVPSGATKGKILLLAEFPGREHRPSHCSVRVNGKNANLEKTSSAGHIGYYLPAEYTAWEKVRSYESEWTWYICEVGSGTSQLRFTGAAAHPQTRLGLWAWMELDLTANRNPVLDMNCSEPAMPQYAPHIERRGICIMRPGQNK